jgi:hypothetical protein
LQHKVKLSIKEVWATMLQLVELVEKKIAKELEQSKHGVIVHDGLTRNVALLASYNRLVKR